MIVRAGGLNVAAEAGLHGVKQLSRETLVQLNPAVILVGGATGQKGSGSLAPRIAGRCKPGNDRRDPTATRVRRPRSVGQFVVASYRERSRAHGPLLHPQAFAALNSGALQQHGQAH